MTNKYLIEAENYLSDEVENIMSKLRSNANSSEIEDPKKMLTSLLSAAKKNEWETALLSSHWATNEEDTSFAISLIRLAGDEAKHLSWLNELTNQEYVPDKNYSPFFKYLLNIQDTFSRVVAGPFAREILAVKRNELFLSFCEKYQFNEVINVYQKIQEDEVFHHKLGKELLDKQLKNEESLIKTKEIIDHMLTIIDDIHEMISLKKGLHYLPGC